MPIKDIQIVDFTDNSQNNREIRGGRPFTFSIPAPRATRRMLTRLARDPLTSLKTLIRPARVFFGPARPGPVKPVKHTLNFSYSNIRLFDIIIRFGQKNTFKFIVDALNTHQPIESE